MKFGSGRNICFAFMTAAWLFLFASMTLVATAKTNHVAKDRKAKFTGTITSREGNTVNVLDKKEGSTTVVNISEGTRIQRGSKTMGVNALVPGLKVNVKGTKTEEGQIEAKNIHLKPDSFDITVAQQQEILDTKAAAAYAQTSADDGITKAGAAQFSADKAQSTADQGVASARAANTGVAANAVAIKTVDQRVSDMGEYTMVASIECILPTVAPG